MKNNGIIKSIKRGNPEGVRKIKTYKTANGDIYELNFKEQLVKNGRVVKRKYSKLQFDFLISDLKKSDTLLKLILGWEVKNASNH